MINKNTMGNNKNNKRKTRNSSDNSSGTASKSKQFKQRGPSDDLDISVSEILNQANSVLYNEEKNISVFLAENDLSDKTVITAKMAECRDKEPTNSDIMKCLLTISDRIGAVEKKLNTLDQLEKKVSGFEKELKSIWAAVEDRSKRMEERVTKLEDKVDGADIGAGLLASKVDELEKARDSLREEVTYLKSQSMRNNLIFTNVPEDNSSGSESPEVTERKLRHHLHEHLKLAKETADSLRFERVHRSPGHPVSGKVRTIVAKFTFFQDRELVRRQWKHLSGTNFNVYEQLPQEIIAKRRRLVPKMKAARDQGKRAWIAYDTLFVDGRAVRE